MIQPLLLMALPAAAGFMLYKNRRDRELRQKELAYRARVSELEMKALRLQMNPHFIFNALNSVNDCISKHETATASYFLVKFARLMRMVLENAEETEITLASELELLHLYLQLESLRLRNNFTYQIMVDDAINPETTMVPPLMLQPFVENSIWHGIGQKPCNGRITVRIVRENGMIACIVKDNGVGRGKTTGVAAPGKNPMGLKITRQRIDMINAVKSNNASISVEDLPEGTRVELKLPLELKY